MERSASRSFRTAGIPLGMVGVLFYLAHTVLGNILWEAYDPVTMDISSLSGQGEGWEHGQAQPAAGSGQGT